MIKDKTDHIGLEPRSQQILGSVEWPKKCHFRKNSDPLQSIITDNIKMQARNLPWH